jgi:hypothetical protein
MLWFLVLSASVRRLHIERGTDAASVSWGDGPDTVRAYNELGEVRCTLNVTVSIQSGRLSKGLWRSMKNGSSATALVPDPLTDLGGATYSRNGRVHVASLPTA